jgi:hypothetical protein
VFAEVLIDKGLLGEEDEEHASDGRATEFEAGRAVNAALEPPLRDNREGADQLAVEFEEWIRAFRGSDSKSARDMNANVTLVQLG